MCGIAGMSVSDGTDFKLIGILLALISGFFWAVYIIYMEKSRLCENSPVLVNFYTTLANVPFTLIACLASGNLGVYSVTWAWGIVAIVAVLHRVIAYGLFQFGLRCVNPFTAGVLCTFEPISALVFGMLLLGERISLRQLVGLLLVLSGICVNLLTSRKKKK